jgi:5-methylcytosine-specific restriction endonuclease McrA
MKCRIRTCTLMAMEDGLCFRHLGLNKGVVFEEKVKETKWKKRKVTGEKALFEEVWNERPHTCEKCGEKLLEFNVWYFHHIKSKGAHPELRLDKNNIMIICAKCHYQEHNVGKAKHK